MTAPSGVQLIAGVLTVKATLAVAQFELRGRVLSQVQGKYAHEAVHYGNVNELTLAARLASPQSQQDSDHCR